MKKRFIVALDSSTSEQDKIFINYLKAKNVGWWHWLNNLWLIYTDTGDLTARKIRDDLNVIYPTTNKIIFELSGDSDTWSGFGPSSEERNMFKWIHENWKKDESATDKPTT